MPVPTQSSLRLQLESLRRERVPVSPWSPPQTMSSLEPDDRGGEVQTTTIFLVGAECPFRCTMCDLWQYTTLQNTPPGAIPFQLSRVLSDGRPNHRQWLKLYNASNFFDPRSIPTEDLDSIANYCSSFERVIVENHPRFCDERMLSFASGIDGQLEVAIGLETIHPGAMAAMNKGMTLDDFDRAVEQCHRFGIDVRTFVLLHPPGIELDQTVEWTCKAVAYAFARHVRHVSIIPVRTGNGWIDKLIDADEYVLPSLSMVRSLFDALSSLDCQFSSKSVLEFDTWDWENLKGGCSVCGPILKEHVVTCNRTQEFLPLPKTRFHCACEI